MNIEKKTEIPQETIRRLSLYLRMLRRLKTQKVKVASSDKITKFLNISSEQFRKDLSYFGEFGCRGVGYNVNFLIRAIEKILGTDKICRIAVIGVGKLGTALIGYPGFTDFKFQIVAAFDNDSAKIGKKIENLIVLDSADVKKELKRLAVKMVILAVPAFAANSVSEDLAKCGIKAILNFSPININRHRDLCVSNVDVACELEGLAYRLKKKMKE